MQLLSQCRLPCKKDLTQKICLGQMLSLRLTGVKNGDGMKYVLKPLGLQSAKIKATFKIITNFKI